MTIRILLSAVAMTAFVVSISRPAESACSPAPFAAGPAGTITLAGAPRPSGFAGRVVDSNGVGLASCLAGSGAPDGTAANPCIFDPVEPGNALSAALGRGLEGFWFLADNVFATSGPASIIGRVVAGLESTFLPATVADGNQTQFQRLRIRMDVNATGYYIVEHPWGSKTYEISSLQSGSGLSKGEINDTLDVPFASGQLVNGLVTPFLKWDPSVLPAAPPGYLGDGFTPHEVVGSACDANFVRVTAVGIDGLTPIAIDPTDADGDGLPHVFTSRLFTVMGQAVSSPIASSPASLDFGQQSMNTTAPGQAVTLTNTGVSALSVTSLTVTTGFDVAHGCTTLAASASCMATLTFTPGSEGSHAGTLTLQTSAGPAVVPLTGTGERSLVTHYYRSILRRVPDAGGKAFWESEKVRLPSLGADVNETWYAMATFFFFSGEYQSFNRDDAGFVTDLYNTFFNRGPDAGGLTFWTGQLASGMPREVVLVSFMFSTEFQGFTQAIFGNGQARKEVDTVVDFYRGLLSRLPDDGGFASWVSQFRSAQCAGAGSVNNTVEAISGSFAGGAEYASRNRTNAEFVGDLYNAFLRRGGDLVGVQFWISQLTGGATRSAIRQQFIASPEFQGRVAAIVAQGCLR
ncbi:MAG: DUF4214 domain-containing protein [Betaproteobacteria bacterium]|nr:DUF4214 domain-containing protein [Betaproteobacteria bacterium]